MIVVGMIDVGGTILTESALRYLGFGIRPPVRLMLNGTTRFLSRVPWLVYGPGIAISSK